MSKPTEFVVRCSWVVNIESRDLAQQVSMRAAEVLGSFERDAGGIPEHTTGFRVDATSKGRRGLYVIEFAPSSLDAAWAIWRLGFLSHPHHEWDLRRSANEATFDDTTVPDTMPESF